MKLTKAQRRVLQWLADNENEADGAITCHGIECWYGHERTNWAMVNGLLQLVLVADVTDGGGCERFAINQSGKRALQGLPPYCSYTGEYFDNFYDLVAAEKGAR